MKLVLITSPIDNVSGAKEADEYVIFARTLDRAHRIFGRFWLNRDSIPLGWAGEDWEVFKLFGERKHLRKVLTGHLEGLGVFDELTGWTIVPPPEPLVL